ncbi:uncharacterized protein [Onthophagus taurus]|uniref:uncharacterized protein n=1 Tax=Onthophagus taurus TaxID=166361 RepID=UPI0039BE0BE4
MKKSLGSDENTFFDFLLTLILFWVSICLTPWIFFSYIAIQTFHTLWIASVSFLYPELTFLKRTTLRTLVETHRNQGIITILLTVKGPPNPASVRIHLEELVRRKDKNGKLVFPHLSDSLIRRCGTYAWSKCNFDLNQNLILAPYSFRGRAINELNVQDCVSDLVCKLLPNNVPPWQMVIIPSSENKHYILLRLHHILLSEGLNIADMLPLIPPVRNNMSESSLNKTTLTSVMKPPSYLPTLKERLTEDLTNHWNEFISNNDPLEKPELFKRKPDFFELLSIILIVFVSTLKETRKNFIKSPKSDLISILKSIKTTVQRECKKRQINFSTFIFSILIMLHPKKVVTTFAKKSLKWSTWILSIPFKIYMEFKAFQSCVNLSYCAYPDTVVGFLYSYVPLTFKALKELLTFWRIIFYTPRTVWDELTKSYEKIETVTLCGRKVTAWSEPVKIESIRKVAKNTSCSDTEIILAAASEALSRFITHTNSTMLKEIPITARNINSNYFLLTGPNVKANDAIGGMLCLNLPILDSRKDANLLENLRDIKDNTLYASETQQLTYLLSVLQTKYGFLSKFLPATLIGIALKYLSLRYSVSFTEITNRQPFVIQSTIWGQEVSSVIYWRPPQANISVSLCANQYGKHVTFGVMCDAQLAPNHHLLVRGFHDCIKDLEASAALQ